MWKIALAFAVLLLFLQPGVAYAVEYTSGLELRVENCLSQVRIGETLSFQARVINQSGQAVQGTLRAYVFGSTDSVSYPLPDRGTTVIVNEGGRAAYDKAVETSVEDQTFSFSVRIRPDVQLVSADETGGRTVRLRVRLGRVENDVFVDTSPPIAKDIVLLPAAGPESIIPVKIGVGVAVATALVLSVMNLRKLNGMSGRKPSNRSVRRRAHRSRVKS